jgi:hypothetical protein
MTTEPPHDAADDGRVLSGKRKSPRRRRSIGVRCVGVGGRTFACRTVDISEGGMLVHITDDAFLPLDVPIDLFPFAARVNEVFPDGMEVVFGDGAVTLRATVVRLVAKPGQHPLLQLGVQFESGLNDVVCRLLGLERGIDETTAPPARVPVDVVPPDEVPAPRASRAPAPAAAAEKSPERSKSAARAK